MPIIITSRFKPLTYDEITRPLIEQTQAQEALENAYIEASDQASQIMAQANMQTDPNSYIKLKNYAEALQQQADVLMHQGLNRNSRQSLINLRRRYGSDIVPIANAIKRRAELLDERRKAGPDYLWEIDNLSLDDLVKNPQADYGAYYNGSMITKRVSDAVKAAANSMVSLETSGHLTPYQIKVLEKHGYTPQEIEQAIAGGANSKSKFLQGVRDRVLDSIDVYNKGSQATRNRALEYANEGLYSAIGSQRYQLIGDERAKAESQWELEKKKLDDRKKEKNTLEDQLPAIVPINIYSRKELDDIDKSTSLYSKYFDISPDGTYILNDRGKKEYEKEVPYPFAIGKDVELYPTQWDTMPNYDRDKIHMDKTPFRKFMDNILTDNVKLNKTDLSPTELGEVFRSYITSLDKYDANKFVEYNYNIDQDEYNDWKTIISNAANGKLYEANWDRKSQTYKKGKSVPIKDVYGNKENPGYVTAIQYSPYGITMNITKDNESKRYFLPRGINVVAENNLNITMNGLKKVQELYRSSTATGSIPMPNEIMEALKNAGFKDVDIPSSITKGELESVIKILLSNSKFYVSQLKNTNKTTPTSWNLVGY